MHFGYNIGRSILCSLVSGWYFLGSHSILNAWLCLRLLMSWQVPSSPTESSSRWRHSSDVLYCNMSEIEVAPSTPMGLRSRYRCFRVVFLQNAAASSTAPSLLMWQSRNLNSVSVHLVWSLNTDDKLSIFAMLKWEFEISNVFSDISPVMMLARVSEDKLFW